LAFAPDIDLTVTTPFTLPFTIKFTTGITTGDYHMQLPEGLP
jgi:hypothetical protein